MSGGCCRCRGCKVMMALPPCSSTVPTTFMAMVLGFAGNPMALGSGIKDCNLLGEIAILPDCNPSRLLSFKFVVEGLYEF